MAYGFGNTVNPQLGATNYSCYLQGALRGAEMQAQGNAALAQGIMQGLQGFAQGIEKYKKKKEEKELKESGIDFIQKTIRSSPELFPDVDPEDRESLGAGYDTVGAEAFLRIKQTLAQAKENQEAAAYSEQLRQGKGMAFLRNGNFMSPFRATPFRESAQIKGQDIYNRRESERLALEERRLNLSNTQSAQRDKVIAMEAQNLAGSIESGGIPFTGNFNARDLGLGVAGFTEQENEQLFNHPLVLDAVNKHQGKVANDILGLVVRGDMRLSDALSMLDPDRIAPFIKTINELSPDLNVRPMTINGIEGVMIGNKFEAISRKGLDGQAYTNAQAGAAALMTRAGVESYGDLTGRDRSEFNILAFNAAKAANQSAIDDPNYFADFFDAIKEAYPNGYFPEAEANNLPTPAGTPTQTGATGAVGSGVPGSPPTPASTPTPAGGTGAGGSGVPGGAVDSFQRALRGETANRPLNVTMVQPVADLGPVVAIGGNAQFLSDPEERALAQAAEGTATPPSTPLPPSSQGGEYPIANAVGTGVAAAVLARKGRRRAEIALERNVAPAVKKALGGSGAKLKSLMARAKSFVKRGAGPVGFALLADSVIGDAITFAANSAAKRKGDDLRDYNKGASEYLAESLARISVDPLRKQEIISRISDEMESNQRSEDLEPNEKVKANRFLQALINNLESVGTDQARMQMAMSTELGGGFRGDEEFPGVPERFRGR
jgi:hypothetical protein